MTTWKPIEKFPLYEVSNDGQVRSWRRKECHWRNPHSNRRDAPIELTGTNTPFGYIAYILRDVNNKVVRKTGHKLVADAFLGKPPSPEHTDVAHNDGNTSNNHVSNLRWATHRENQMDMRKHGTMQDGEKCCTSKLTEQDVKNIIRIHFERGRGSGVYLAKKYSVRPSQISRIVNGRRWAYLKAS